MRAQTAAAEVSSFDQENLFGPSLSQKAPDGWESGGDLLKQRGRTVQERRSVLLHQPPQASFDLTDGLDDDLGEELDSAFNDANDHSPSPGGVAHGVSHTHTETVPHTHTNTVSHACTEAVRHSVPQAQSVTAPKASIQKRVPLHPAAGQLTRDISLIKGCVLCDEASPWFDTSRFSWKQSMDELNTRVFGNKSFLPLQAEVINAALSGKDVFVMLPTGGGKSLCYQLTALLDPGVTAVVMPLVSLMQDQHDILFGLNIKAKVLSGTLSWDETKAIHNECLYPDALDPLKILFVTPEKLGASESLMELLKELYNMKRLSRFVVDEAHCVSQWGNDFRPEYKTLKVLRTKFPSVPILALTASATVDILEDVLRQLGMRDVQIFRRTFDRPNLKYLVEQRTPKTMQEVIIPLIKRTFKGQCGIVYCLSRANCDEVANELKAARIKADRYHGGMSASERETVQRGWMAEEFLVMVATIAFGMGINKRDVRFVIHLAMPKCIENYYQESGRAGRDGEISQCILFFDMKDKARHQWLNSHSTTGEVQTNGINRGLRRACLRWLNSVRTEHGVDVISFLNTLVKSFKESVK
eukprot:Blabericola_migrator_1__797@NODE_119_length_13646_cov_70_025112_g107_i0_p3_GENE_NODE_119_length_13646_cov_70_025112_g107_i0NODE_119_length_13646_cov_70_025112_g107_i0_p3_ORF_typecomplete_len585_score133_97DEAD/PF00270_29/2_7e24DEAD/PF00270_29/1_2e02Helicase_C/PF00271_31/6_4e03Helicase_C/PF00271_31/4e03Helicase_C/PF00271_31/1_4e19Helicase_C/PF00271_31/1_5e04ResIII/PF04851_15/8_7e03ResIII/PF04851_15/2_8e06_NODE_119_length_13646_cov_70_025112_g107_i0860210356